MDGLAHFWAGSDGVGRAVGLLLLAMSVSAWVLILWKARLLRRARRDIAEAVPAFWSAGHLAAGRERLLALDGLQLLLPLVAAADQAERPGTLAARADAASQLTRRLRDALHLGLAQLQAGQVVLASIGSTAPFVGLFGTVWGIYHALADISAGGALAIEQVAGPVGEALVMTAAGLAVAIPAVLAYNLFGNWAAACEAELEGFAHDLRELALGAGPSSESSAAAGPAADEPAGR